MLWIEFAVCTAMILFSGNNLSKYGDIIAEKSGLGRTWVGVLLIASVTSLPELITGISSVAIFDLPDIAAGNIIGACMLNICTVAWLDVIGGSTPISSRAHEGHILTAGFGILLLGLVGLSILIGEMTPAIGWVGTYSFLLLGLYVVAMRMVFLHERKRVARFVTEFAEELQYRKLSAGRVYGLFAVNAVLIIVAALYLPRLGEDIAKQTGLGKTFVGSVFIAISTTLPELVVSFSAVRLGAVDMAIANLFGSNLFNVSVLAVDDLFYTRGPLLSFVSVNHVMSALAAITMTAIAVIGLTYRTEKKTMIFAWDTLAILLVYATATSALYSMR